MRSHRQRQAQSRRAMRIVPGQGKARPRDGSRASPGSGQHGNDDPCAKELTGLGSATSTVVDRTRGTCLGYNRIAVLHVARDPRHGRWEASLGIAIACQASSILHHIQGAHSSPIEPILDIQAPRPWDSVPCRDTVTTFFHQSGANNHARASWSDGGCCRVDKLYLWLGDGYCESEHGEAVCCFAVDYGNESTRLRQHN